MDTKLEARAKKLEAGQTTQSARLREAAARRARAGERLIPLLFRNEAYRLEHPEKDFSRIDW